jgi:beta-lactam-binding protein with PASTA domain
VRPRRHTRPTPGLFRSAPGRRFLRDLALVAGTAAVGYAVSALWLSPVSPLAREVPVPRVLELPEDQARAELGRVGLRSRLAGRRPHQSLPRGAVVWQHPPPGTALPPNAVVELVASQGPALVPIPELAGLALPEALRALAAAGMQVGAVDTIGSQEEVGVVLATRPRPGTARPAGSRVDLVVSGGFTEEAEDL